MYNIIHKMVPPQGVVNNICLLVKGSFHLVMLSTIVLLTLINISHLITCPALAFKDHTGRENSDLYKIVWKGPYEEAKINVNGLPPDEIINIATKYGERYKCLLPTTIEQLNFDSTATNSSSEDTLKDKTPYQLIEPLVDNNVCSYRFELYWVYELCHGKHLRQYHEEGTKYKSQVGQTYYLGRLDADQLESLDEEFKTQKQELESSGASWPKKLIDGLYRSYVTVNMTGGTLCDLTKKSRKSRIIYACNLEQRHELYSIKEVSTCDYEVIVLTPLLCAHRDFKLETVTQHEIHCFSVGKAPKKPTQTIEPDEDEDEDGIKDTNKRRGVAYLQGRTLIIDADLLFG